MSVDREIEHAASVLNPPVKFASVTLQEDNANNSRVSITFVVEDETWQKAIAAAKSDEVIRRGIKEAQAKGLARPGISAQGVAIPCDKTGKPFEAQELLNAKEAAGPKYVTITHTYLGEM